MNTKDSSLRYNFRHIGVTESCSIAKMTFSNHVSVFLNILTQLITDDTDINSEFKNLSIQAGKTAIVNAAYVMQLLQQHSPFLFLQPIPVPLIQLILGMW